MFLVCCLFVYINGCLGCVFDNLQAAECNQLQQTPIYKIGGGGARAARRIQIRRPRLAERGAKACRIQCQKSADSKASCGPRPTRRALQKLPGKSPFADPRTPNCRFWQTFCRSKIHQKSDSSKTLPKSQNSDPRAPNV